MPWDPKITWQENGQITVGQYDKSAYGVIISYSPCTLSSANKLIYAVSAHHVDTVLSSSGTRKARFLAYSTGIQLAFP